MENIKILLVEDLTIARVAAKLILNKFNCEIDEAENGTRALDLLNTRSYHIVFMDIGLPDINGITVTQKVRANLEGLNCKTPIVALTAQQEGDYKIKCSKAGMNGFITKPLTEARTKEVIETVAPSL